MFVIDLQLELELVHLKDELTITKESLARVEPGRMIGGTFGPDAELKKRVEELEEECKKLAERNESLELHLERSALKVIKSHYSSITGSVVDIMISFLCIVFILTGFPQF